MARYQHYRFKKIHQFQSHSHPHHCRHYIIEIFCIVFIFWSLICAELSLHKSVHYRPFCMQVQLSCTRSFLQSRDRNSMTARGAGSPSPQSVHHGPCTIPCQQDLALEWMLPSSSSKLHIDNLPFCSGLEVKKSMEEAARTLYFTLLSKKHVIAMLIDAFYIK